MIVDLALPAPAINLFAAIGLYFKSSNRILLSKQRYSVASLALLAS